MPEADFHAALGVLAGRRLHHPDRRHQREVAAAAQRRVRRDRARHRADHHERQRQQRRGHDALEDRRRWRRGNVESPRSEAQAAIGFRAHVDVANP